MRIVRIGVPQPHAPIEGIERQGEGDPRADEFVEAGLLDRRTFDQPVLGCGAPLAIPDELFPAGRGSFCFCLTS